MLFIRLLLRRVRATSPDPQGSSHQELDHALDGVTATEPAVTPLSRPTTPATALATPTATDDDEERMWQEAIARARTMVALPAPPAAAPAAAPAPAEHPAPAGHPAAAADHAHTAEPSPRPSRRPVRLPRPTRPPPAPPAATGGRMSLARADQTSLPADLAGQEPPRPAPAPAAAATRPRRPAAPRLPDRSKSREALARVLAMAKPRRRSEAMDTTQAPATA